MKAILNIALVAHDSRKNELYSMPTCFQNTIFTLLVPQADSLVSLLSEQRKNRNIRSRTR